MQKERKSLKAPNTLEVMFFILLLGKQSKAQQWNHATALIEALGFGRRAPDTHPAWGASLLGPGWRKCASGHSHHPLGSWRARSWCCHTDSGENNNSDYLKKKIMRSFIKKLNFGATQRPKQGHFNQNLFEFFFLIPHFISFFPIVIFLDYIFIIVSDQKACQIHWNHETYTTEQFIKLNSFFFGPVLKVWLNCNNCNKQINWIHKTLTMR